MQRLWLIGLAAFAAVVLAACGSSSTTGDADQTVNSPDAGEVAAPANDGEAEASFSQRIDAIDGAIATWRNAASVEEALVAAETAFNLVVGPNGPGYGDRDGDGLVSGSTDIGLLPGLDGTPVGLAMPLVANECVVRDVLGGSWSDPVARWNEMLSAIDRWRPDNNTMPSLASHPMRIVGWATFSQEAGSLDLAQVYAGHAKLHIDISRGALDC